MRTSKITKHHYPSTIWRERDRSLEAVELARPSKSTRASPGLAMLLQPAYPICRRAMLVAFQASVRHLPPRAHFRRRRHSSLWRLSAELRASCCNSTSPRLYLEPLQARWNWITLVRAGCTKISALVPTQSECFDAYPQTCTTSMLYFHFLPEQDLLQQLTQSIASIRVFREVRSNAHAL